MWRGRAAARLGIESASGRSQERINFVVGFQKNKRQDIYPAAFHENIVKNIFILIHQFVPILLSPAEWLQGEG